MKKIKYILFAVIFLGVGLFTGNNEAYAADFTEEKNVCTASDALENATLLYSDGDIAVYVQDKGLKKTRSSYTKSHTYWMTNSSQSITYVKWDVDIYYSYSDGSYVTIDSVNVDQNIYGGLVTVFPHTINDYIHINNYQ